MTQGRRFTRSMIVGAVAITLGIVATSTSAQTAAATKYTVRTLPLPDNGTGDVSMDYIAFDPATNSLWVPGGNTGAVDVVDVVTPATHLLYVGAARAAKLTIARADNAAS